MCLVVIDELDQLLGGDHEALHALFEWAAAPSSNLVLLGIANSLDMMQRSLPRLRARRAVPQTLTFPPYAPGELASILTQRVAQAIALHRSSGEGDGHEARSGKQLASPVQRGLIVPIVASPTRASGGTTAAGPLPCATLALNEKEAEMANPVIEHAAMVFCARKVAAASGDARRALQVFGLAVEGAAEELRQSSLASPSRGASSSAEAASGERQPLWLENPALRVDHMSSALGAAFKSRVIALLESLPQHQQLLLCALVLRGRRASAPDAPCTLADLHASYKRLCSSQRLSHLPANEVLPICHNMAACGVFGIGEIGARSLSRASAPARRSADLSTPVWLAIAEADLKEATQEIRFFRNLLCS
jgi:cell division control protein 6